MVGWRRPVGEELGVRREGGLLPAPRLVNSVVMVSRQAGPGPVARGRAGGVEEAWRDRFADAAPVEARRCF